MLPLNKLNDIKNVSPDQVAIIDNSISLTWRDYYELARNCTIRLSKIRQPRRVVFMSENRVEMLVLMSAFSSLGIPLIGLDYTMKNERLLACVTSVEGDLLLYSSQYEDRANWLSQQVQIEAWCIDEICPHLYSPIEDEDWSKSERPFESIVFTSGTTGNPKPIMRRTSFDSQRFSYLQRRFQFSSEDAFLLTLPFYHSSALGWARLFLSLGGKVVLTNIEDPVVMYNDLVQHQITSMLIVPPILAKLIEANHLTDQYEGNVKFIIVGGKNFSADLKMKAISCFGEVVHEYYGTSETGINTIADAYDILNYPNSSGKPIDGCEIKIVDEQGNDLGYNELGKIVISGYQNMDEYLNHSAQYVNIDGKDYFVSPDYGYLTMDQRLYLVSRNPVTYHNSYIQIYDIENKIRNMGAFDDVYLHYRAMPQSPNEHCMYCFVTTSQSMTEQEVNSKIAPVLKGQCSKHQIYILDQIPYSLSGKVKLEEINNIIVNESSSVTAS